LETRRARADEERREEYARKLKSAVRALENAGQELGVEISRKKIHVENKEYEEAKVTHEIY